MVFWVMIFKNKSFMLSCAVVSVCKVVQISFFVDHDSLLISYLHLSQFKKVFFLYNNKFPGTKRFSTMAARMLQRDRHFKKGKLDQSTVRPLQNVIPGRSTCCGGLSRVIKFKSSLPKNKKRHRRRFGRQ